MKHELITLLTLTFALVGAAADKSAANKSDAYPQDGVWKPISAALAGSKVPKPALSAISLRISGANYEVSVIGEKQPDRGTHTLDDSTTPKRITITSTNGPNKGKTFLGIYEVKDANSLQVCYDLSGTAYPAKFESSAENGHYLVEYRRNDDKAASKPTNAAEDAKRQNGIWKPAGAILGGEKLKREELNKITLTIKDGDYEVVVDGEPHADKGTVSLDTSVTPKRMSIQGVEGPNKGKTILAIYEMGQTEGGDTFRVCYDLSGQAFPTDFTSPKGSMHYLVGYRRQKGSAPVVPERK
jgi:uncharacterized protein (TIGR03067 family)